MMKNDHIVEQETLSHLTVFTIRNKIVSAMMSFVVSYYVTWQNLEMGCASVSVWK